MRRLSIADKRLAAEMAAEHKGYEVLRATSRGVPERARFVLRRPNGETLHAIVRITNKGLFGFTRDHQGEWKPLKRAKVVLAVMKSVDRERQGLEVLAFPKEIIVAALNQALDQLTALNRRPPNELPVFISVDAYNRPDAGHVIPGIRRNAEWSETIHGEELDRLIHIGDTGYIEEARHEFARRNRVDVRKVSVTFSVGP